VTTEETAEREPEKPRDSTLRFVAAAAGCALSIGLVVITATVLAVDELRGDGSAPSLDRSFYILVGGTLLGILLAASAAWRLLAPIESVYRRGGLSIVCAFGTVLLMLICIPVHQLLGQVGLIALLAVAAVTALILGRGVHRMAVRG
jgi:ABC-type glycerol-3-phosphate transport system permease component